MRIGLSISSSHGVDDPREGARLMIERAAAANRADLDSLSLGDHHGRSSPYYQNTPMLGRLLADWQGRAGCLFLAPLWNPVLMAEQIGTLASLTSGRFIVQVGVGDGADQFAAMGADLGSRGRRTEATIRLVSELLAGATAADEDLGVGPVRIAPLPAEPVEWWLGAGAPRSLDRAARLGDAWYCGPAATAAQASALLDRYRAARAEHGLDEGRAILRRDVIVTASRTEAEHMGDDLIARGYRGMSREAVACGDPESVAEQFAAYGDIGFSKVIARCMTVPQPVALETIDLLGGVQAMLRR